MAHQSLVSHSIYLTCCHVAQDQAVKKGHSESLRISDHIFPSLAGRDQMGHDPFKSRNPVQISAQVIFVSWFLSVSIFQ